MLRSRAVRGRNDGRQRRQSAVSWTVKPIKSALERIIEDSTISVVHVCNSQRVCFSLLALLLLGGCQHRMGRVDVGHSRMPVVSPARPAPVIAPIPTEAPSMDLQLLDSPEFYPPGAKHLVPTDLPSPATVDFPRANFPHAGLYTSPDAQWSLTEIGFEQWDGIHLTLEAIRRGTDVFHNLLQTRSAHVALWAPDSRHAALTLYTGSNWSMVYVIDVPRHELSEPIYPAHALVPYLPADQLDAPQFVSAYRWTQDGRLVLRGVGRYTTPPYTLFGYELLATLHDDRSPDLIFLRGYTKDIPVSAAVPQTKPRDPSRALPAASQAGSGFDGLR